MSDKAVFDVVKVEIEEFDRVPPTVTKNIRVTITPSPLSSNWSLNLACETDRNTVGSATVNPASINTTTTVTVTGGVQSWGSNDQTSAPDNIKLTAKINATPFDKEPFTVSAVPTNFRQIGAMVLPGAVLHFRYVWDSDSGNVGDLDKVWVGEYVTYSDGGNHVGLGRPWKGNFRDPTILPDRNNKNGNLGTFQDSHSPPGGLPNLGPADSFTATQHYGYRDFRSHGRNVINESLEWQTNLMGPITITRTVEYRGLYWYYTIEKSGTIAEAQLN